MELVASEAKIINKFEDESEYVFYSMNEIIKQLYLNKAKNKYIMFSSNAPKVIIKYKLGEIKRIYHQITGTAALQGITILYRKTKEQSSWGGWKPLEVSATKKDATGIKIEMFRYDVESDYEILIYFPLYSQIDEMEIGIQNGFEIKYIEPPNEKILFWGNFFMGQGIASSAFFVSNIISRRIGYQCLDYTEDEVLEILDNDLVKNVKYIIYGVSTRYGNKKALEELEDRLSYLIEHTNARILVWQDPLVYYNNHKESFNNCSAIYEMISKDVYKKRVDFISMENLEEMFLLYDCTLSCNYFNDYGYVLIAKNIIDAIEGFEGVGNGN